MATSTPAVPLGPRSPSRCRFWHVTHYAHDAGALAARAAAPAGTPVIMLPGSETASGSGSDAGPGGGACLDSFVCAAAVLRDLAERLGTHAGAGTPGASLARRLIAAAADLAGVTAHEHALDARGDLESAILGDGGALAALRRVSRESAGSALMIDTAGRLVADALEWLGPVTVITPDVTRIDRPSLKVLARGCLLAPADSRVTWIWRQSRDSGFSTDAGAAMADDVADGVFGRLAADSRDDLLATLRAILRVSPVVTSDTAAGPSGAAGPLWVSARTVAGACAWLSTQNYDAGLWWAAGLTRSSVDDHRLIALILTNLGLHDQAIDQLTAGHDKARHATLRAHLLYMQALIWSKRKFDLARSEDCIARAHQALDAALADDPGDVAMERAWLHNGQAMNALLVARFAGRPVAEAFPLSYDHLTRAFAGVTRGHTPDRTYLRFNLLGNMSNLMEIRGEYAVALDLLTKTFDEDLTARIDDGGLSRAAQLCMRAGLMARSGDPASALPLFATAHQLVTAANRPLSVEILARSLGTTQLRLGLADQARTVFTAGLDQALASRGAVGARIHGAGLATCHLRQGRPDQALDLVMRLGDEDGLWLVPPDAAHARDLSALAPPSSFSSLPTSLPEIDLEGLHGVSIARVLHGHSDDLGRLARARCA
ncbi:hypothetical protein WG924_09510 [Tistrella sp. 25B02-3]